MKSLVSILLIIINLFAGLSNLAIIADKDGFVNIRDGTSVNSNIVGQIQKDSIFSYTKIDCPWWEVEYKGHKGYIHSSKMIPLDQLSISQIQNLYNDDWAKKSFQIDHGNVTILFFQAIFKKGQIRNTPPAYCSSFLEIKNSNGRIVRKYFPDIMPYGGAFGIFPVEIKSQPDFKFFVKLGDYDGRLIIIKKTGQIDDIDGGDLVVFNNFVISRHYTDCCTDPLVWDLKAATITQNFVFDTTLSKPSQEIKFAFYTSGNRLIMEASFPTSKAAKWYSLDSLGRFDMIEKPLKGQLPISFQPIF
jgi:hypothetical protein